MSKGRTKHHVSPNEKQDQARSFINTISRDGISVQASREIPSEKDEDCHQSVPWELNEDIRYEKGLPRIRFRWPLASLIEGTLEDEVGQDLWNYG